MSRVSVVGVPVFGFDYQEDYLKNLMGRQNTEDFVYMPRKEWDGMVTYDEWKEFSARVERYYELPGIHEEIEKYNSKEALKERQKKGKKEMEEYEKNYEKAKIEKTGFFYLLRIKNGYPSPVVKIGIATNWENRLNQYLKTYGEDKIEVLYVGKTKYPISKEKHMRQRYTKKAATVGLDWFCLDDQDIKEIIEEVENEQAAAS